MSEQQPAGGPPEVVQGVRRGLDGTLLSSTSKANLGPGHRHWETLCVQGHLRVFAAQSVSLEGTNLCFL